MKARVIILLLLLVVTTRAATPATLPAATGRLQLSFTEHSPLSNRDTVYRRIGVTKTPPPDPEFPAEFDLATEPFDVYVSPKYRPDVPQGVFVWMGVTEASAEWFDVLARHKLIFIDSKPANKNIDYINVRKPVDGVHNLKQRYNIDDKRIFISGFSAGADMASYTLFAYPDVFRGAVLMMGGGFYFTSIDKQRHAVASAQTRQPWQGPIETIREFPLVLMRGQREPVSLASAQYEALLLDGFVRATYMEVPGIAHNHPNARWFENAINALDHPQIKKAPTTAPTNDPKPLPGQVAQAKRLIASAEHYLMLKTVWGKKDGKLAEDGARKYLQQVLEQYPTTPSAARALEMLKKLDPPTTEPAK